MLWSKTLLQTAVLALLTAYVTTYEIAFYPAVVENIPETKDTGVKVYLTNCTEAEFSSSIDVKASLKVGE